MCAVSAVMDHYKPIIPDDWKPNISLAGITVGQWPPPALASAEYAEIAALRVEIANMTKVVADFKADVEAARVVDRLTGQPDCVDPDKAKLEARVADLERKLSAVLRALSGEAVASQ